MLNPIQIAHVASVYPECKAEMMGYLSAVVDVMIFHETECGSDVPPIAIAVAANTEFWIDCCETMEGARSQAESLGLRVVDH